MGELALKSLFDVKDWDNLEARSNHPSIVRIIKDKVENFYSVNVDDTMKTLVTVGTMLQLAYSGSNGHHCNTTVLTVLSRYQDVIKKSSMTSTTFVRVSLEALRYHNLALILADKEKGDGALKMIGKCVALAVEMVNETDKLLRKVDELCEISERALIETTENKNLTGKDQKKVIEFKKQRLVEQKYFETKLKGYADAVSEERKKATTARIRAEKADEGWFWNWMSPSINSVSNQSDEEAEKSRKEQMEANKQRQKYQEKELQMNADFTKVVEQLRNSSIENNKLQNAILSLHIFVKTLGNVTLQRLAASENKSHPCNPNVLEVFNLYHDVIKESSVNISTFVQVALEALKYHKFAFTLIDKKKEDSALKLIEKCVALAVEMAIETDQVFITVEETTNNQNVTDEELKELIRVQKDKSAKQKYFETQVKELAKAVSEAEKETETVRNRADPEERNLISNLLPSISPSLTEQSVKTEKKYCKKKMEEEKQRQNYEEKEPLRNADLATVVAQLINSSRKEDDLQNAIISLQIVIETLGNLTLRRLANSESKGHACCTNFLEVLSRYHDVIKESSVNSTNFVQVALEASQYHKLALTMTDKGMEDSALKLIENGVALAVEMAYETDQLFITVDDMCKMLESALEETTKNQNVTDEELKELIRVQKDKSAKQNYFQTQVKDLAKAISEARNNPAAQAQKPRSFLAKVLGVFSRRNTTSEKLLIYELECEKRRREYQDMERSMNAELAKIVEQLKNSSIEEDELKTAIISLELTVKTLGKVKTVFQNVKTFWEEVSIHCRGLSCNRETAKDMLELEEKKLFIEEIKESGYCWLAFGKINRKAALAIRDVDGMVDNVMSDLPTKEEAKRLIDTHIIENEENKDSQIDIEDNSNHTNLEIKKLS